MTIERELELRSQQRELNRQMVEEGLIPPTRRKIGQRKYKSRIPEFKELDTDMPTAKNLEGSNEPLKYTFILSQGPI